MKKIIILIPLIFLILICHAFSQIGASLTKTGTTAAQFLKIGIGSRALGMGGAFVASSNDVSAIYWNPAGIALIENREAAFNHVDWLMDVSFDHASFAMNFGDFGTVGAFVGVMSMGEMLVRTVEKPEGTGEYFGAGAMTIGLSYARNLTQDFAIGFNAKYIREFIWHEIAQGFALDIGTLYRLQFLNETRLAASISNFGTKMKLSGRDLLVLTNTGPGGANIINTEHQVDEYDLPLLFRIGVAVDAIKSEQMRLTIETNAIHPNDNTEYLNTGFEYAWNEKIFIRAGYKSLFERDSEQGLTWGLGLNYRLVDFVNLKFDYAYQDFGRLKNVHYLTLGVNF
ncbi:MAG: PorV/PorQ family protein [Ignavibacteria bacterium]|nr:PorV/PorQ family protein [Ignavibacteria bacterium]